MAGIRVDGGRPFDLQVRDDRFYRRVLAGGSLALGESYMDGWWECEALDRFFRMWSDYLLSCAGCFRARRLQLWQVLFSKYGLRGGCPLAR